jgi:hypothetical protein
MEPSVTWFLNVGGQLIDRAVRTSELMRLRRNFSVSRGKVKQVKFDAHPLKFREKAISPSPARRFFLSYRPLGCFLQSDDLWCRVGLRVREGLDLFEPPPVCNLGSHPL